MKTISKMKLTIIVLLSGVLLAGCTTTDKEVEETVESKVESFEDTPENIKEYETILTEYTEKLEATKEIVAAEYEEEATALEGDPDALSELAEKKIETLDKVFEQGINKMNDIVTNKSGTYNAYEKFGGDLSEVYMEVAEEVMQRYLDFGLAETGVTNDSDSFE